MADFTFEEATQPPPTGNGDAKTFSFEEAQQPIALPTKPAPRALDLSSDLSSGDPMRIAQAQQSIVGKMSGMLDTGLAVQNKLNEPKPQGMTITDPENLMSKDSGSGIPLTGINPWQDRQMAKYETPADALMAKYSGQNYPATPDARIQLAKAVTDVNTPALPVSSTVGQIGTAAMSPPKPFTDIVNIGRGIQENNRDTTLAMRQMATKGGLDPDTVALLPGLVESWLRGGGNAIVDTTLSLTAPGMLATGGLAKLPSLVQRAASLGFAAQMASNFPEQAQQFQDEMKKPAGQRDNQKIAQMFVGMLGTEAFTGMAAAHGLARGKSVLPKDAAGVTLGSDLKTPQGAKPSVWADPNYVPPDMAATVAPMGGGGLPLDPKMQEQLDAANIHISPGMTETILTKKIKSPRAFQRVFPALDLTLEQAQEVLNGVWGKNENVPEKYLNQPAKIEAPAAAPAPPVGVLGEVKPAGIAPVPPPDVSEAIKTATSLRSALMVNGKPVIGGDSHNDILANAVKEAQRTGNTDFADAVAKAHADDANHVFVTENNTVLSREQSGPVYDRLKGNKEGTTASLQSHQLQDLTKPLPASDDPFISRIANRFTQERSLEGEIGEIAPGQGYSTKELVNRGLKMKPEEVAQHIADLMNDKGGNAKLQAAAIRAEEARLSDKSTELSRVADAKSEDVAARKAADDAFKALTDFHNGPVAKMKNNWHAQGMSMQGEIPVDLSTFNGLREAWLRDNGKAPPPRMEPEMRRTARNVRKAVADERNVTERLGKEIDRVTRGKKSLSPESVRDAIIERMKDMPCRN